jgi:hypothetical protein
MQDQLLSDDFPPIRERKSSEDPIRVPSRPRCRSSAVQKVHKQRRPPRSESPPQSPLRPRRPRLPNTGLGGRNILNTREVTVRHAQVSIKYLVGESYANI